MTNAADLIDKISVHPAPEPVARRFDLGFNMPKCMPASVIRMHSAAQLLLREMATPGRHPRWLTLIGQSGCGKTYLSKAVRTAVRDELFIPAAQYWNVSRIADMLRSGHYDLLDQLANLSFLVLDDLGAEHTTEFSRSKLYQILDRRLGKWTLITSNMSVGQIGDSLDVRIASRINRGGPVINISDAFDYCKATSTYYVDNDKKHCI